MSNSAQGPHQLSPTNLMPLRGTLRIAAHRSLCKEGTDLHIQEGWFVHRQNTVADLVDSIPAAGKHSWD